MDNQKPVVVSSDSPEIPVSSPTLSSTSSPVKKHPHKFIYAYAALIVIAAIAGGIYAWQHNKVTADSKQLASLNKQVTSLQKQLTNLQKTSIPTSSFATSPPIATNPYAGWKSYTLKQEKLSFKYPTTWTLKDISYVNDDYVLLNGTSGFEMQVGAGSAVSAVDNYSANCIAQADKVMFNNQAAYLDLTTVDQLDSSCTPVSNPATIGPILLSDSSQSAAHSNFFPTKNLTSSNNPAIIVNIDYNGPSYANQNNYKTVSFIEGDVNYTDAKLVVDSMAY